MINTQVATATGALSWVIVERFRDGKPTTLGIASGAISGAVAITPACGFVDPIGAMFIGLIAGAVCSLAVGLKYRLGYDDSLDVVGVHGVGGLVGMLAIGLFATVGVNEAGANGLFHGGGLELMGKQVVASLATLVYAFGVTWVIAKVVDLALGFRISPEDEISGIDLSEHAESAYEYTDTTSGSFAGVGLSGLHHTQQRLREEDQ